LARGVEVVLADRVEQRGRLDAVTRLALPRVGDPPPVDRVLDLGHDEPLGEFGHPGVAIRDHLGEIVAGVDVHDREGEPARSERLDRQVQQDRRVLPAAEEEDGPL
jgi:hypothetical protein